MNENQQVNMSVEDVAIDVPTAPVEKKKKVKSES